MVYTVGQYLRVSLSSLSSAQKQRRKILRGVTTAGVCCSVCEVRCSTKATSKLITMPQSLHSLLLSKKATASSPINYVRQIPEESSPSQASRQYSEQCLFPRAFEEEELAGTSEMVYDDALRHDDIPETRGEIQMDDCTPIKLKLQDISPSSALTAFKADTNYQAELQRMEIEKDTLTSLIQQQQRIISALEGSCRDHSSVRDELDLKSIELEEVKSNSRRERLENEATIQRLSADNTFLTTSQADVTADSYSSERKCAALDAIIGDLHQKVTEMPQGHEVALFLFQL